MLDDVWQPGMRVMDSLARVFILIIAIYAPIASAVEAVVTWDAPTQYVNGDPLPPDQIESYSIGHGEDWQTVTSTTATYQVNPGYNCWIISTLATNGLSSIFASMCADVPSNSPPETPVYICP